MLKIGSFAIINLFLCFNLLAGPKAPDHARVVIVQDSQATEVFQPQADRVNGMVQRGLLALALKKDIASAWRVFVKTQDVIGIKVYSAPGPQSGTRPAVVEAIIKGLLEAKVEPENIIIWDKLMADLRKSGFTDLAAKYGIRAEGSLETGYDWKVSYDESPLIGQLIWGDLEFGSGKQAIGKKSYVTKILTKEVTKVINVTPLLNHYRAGVTGNLYSLAAGSVDNFMRFENEATRLADAVPDIYNLPVLADHVVLNIVDALICQYEGEDLSRLHYSIALNELRLSTDPVALDVLSLAEIAKQRKAAKLDARPQNLKLYSNASELLELGVSELPKIQIERVK
jgi:uncharacterized protein (DUF362 family)